MVELAAVVHPYAEVLFRMAKAGNLGVRFELVSEVGQIVAVPDMKVVADGLRFFEADVAETFLSVPRSPVSHEAKELVGLPVANKYLSLLPEIAAQFYVLRNASEDVADVEITSASSLEGVPLTELVTTLEHKLGKKLQAHVSVDPSLIDGVHM